MKFLRSIPLQIFVILIAGCAVFGELEDKTAAELVDVAERYCENTDQAWRSDFREKFNSQFGGSVVITCPE